MDRNLGAGVLAFLLIHGAHEFGHPQGYELLASRFGSVEEPPGLIGDIHQCADRRGGRLPVQFESRRIARDQIGLKRKPVDLGAVHYLDQVLALRPAQIVA